jgi:hypothetical protein
MVDFGYLNINCKKQFDIINLANYDIVLGMSFMFQHKILLAMNPMRIVIGSLIPLPLEGEEVRTVMMAMVQDKGDELERVRKMLTKEVDGLCGDMAKAALPLMRAINHAIPLIDENKTYRFCQSKCLKPLESQWHKKSKEYLANG